MMLDNTTSRVSSCSWRRWEPLVLLGVEVLGYSKTLEETPSVFMPEDGVIGGIVLTKRL
jgi:hypothetical protein